MDDVVVANEYSDVFEFVDDFFDIANTSLIIDLLKKDSFLISESAVLIKNLSALRRLNEHLMDIACENILKVNVSDITTNSGKRTVDIMDALEKHIKIQSQYHLQ
ncbi:MAG: hypothetical protein IPH33_18435 [Bacteroidetes bacterium]|nr:hypothetical protein [Bacteroidota bacterium]